MLSLGLVFLIYVKVGGLIIILHPIFFFHGPKEILKNLSWVNLPILGQNYSSGDEEPIRSKDMISPLP